MALLAGKAGLEADLIKLYRQGITLRSTPIWAKEKADAIHKYCLTGIPTVVITNFPGPVISGMTGGPVLGVGLGGFDKPLPGMGLPAAKVLLKADLIKIWTHKNSVRTIEVIAKEMAEAIHKYYNQAIIQTLETSMAPLPAPPPVGPVVGPMFGLGGTLSSVTGTGFNGAKPPLEAEFIRIWNQIDYKAPRSIEQFALEMSEAIHAFCICGKVATVGTILAPAVVAPPPLPPMGSYGVGKGLGIGTVT